MRAAGSNQPVFLLLDNRIAKIRKQGDERSEVEINVEYSHPLRPKAAEHKFHAAGAIPHRAEWSARFPRIDIPFPWTLIFRADTQKQIEERFQVMLFRVFYVFGPREFDRHEWWYPLLFCGYAFLFKHLETSQTYFAMRQYCSVLKVSLNTLTIIVGATFYDRSVIEVNQ
jgi:hypothetical protein